MSKLRFGIIGAGPIANTVMPALLATEAAEVVAVATRRPEQARDFCKRWAIPTWEASIEALCANNQVDIVYVATPHIVHDEHCRLALTQGKHVLCEKPMAMNRQEAQGLQALAKQRGLFLMEGIWSRFFPAMRWVKRFLQDGTLGDPIHITASFTQFIEYDEKRRFFNEELGGGSMRGAGIYPVAMASMLFGWEPVRIQSDALMKNNVDLHSGALLTYPGGRMAQLYSGFDGRSACMASITFERGSLTIPQFLCPDMVIYTSPNQSVTPISFPFQGTGFQFEFEEVCRCVLSGQTECEIMPMEETVGMTAMIDAIYAQWRTA